MLLVKIALLTAAAFAKLKKLDEAVDQPALRKLTKEQLVVGRAVALMEQGWCGSTRAVTVDGFAVSPLSSRAKKFCAIGALSRAIYDEGMGVSYALDGAPSRSARQLHDKILDKVRSNDRRGLVMINDVDGREAAIGALKRAVELT